MLDSGGKSDSCNFSHDSTYGPICSIGRGASQVTDMSVGVIIMERVSRWS